MKDEHDNSTGELLPFPAADGGGRGTGLPEARTAAAGVEVNPRDLRQIKLQMDRDYRAREGLCTFLPVAMVAKEWGVTSRRVRFLLASGRLNGRQNENGYWEVCYPYTITEGRRGPPLRRRGAKASPKKAELRLV